MCRPPPWWLPLRRPWRTIYSSMQQRLTIRISYRRLIPRLGCRTRLSRSKILVVIFSVMIPTREGLLLKLSHLRWIILSPSHTWMLFVHRVGTKQCKKNLMLSSIITHGNWSLLNQAEISWTANGYSRSRGMQMGLLNATRGTSGQRVQSALWSGLCKDLQSCNQTHNRATHSLHCSVKRVGHSPS
jgi:hypothetical protein